MTIPAHLKIGTLGSSATFAGEATAILRSRYKEFSEPVYFKSMDDCWNELSRGAVDAVVLGCERTGQPHHGDAVVTRGFYVLGSINLPIICNLYVKPGARKENIRAITGHGSIFQCIDYLDKNFPGVPREMHGHNSVEAARAMMAGDGSAAVVGSRSLPTLAPGVEVFAERIDDGSISSWWVISTKPYFVDRPKSLVITGEFGPDGKLGGLIKSVMAAGYQTSSVASFASKHGISTYNYVLTFEGTGRRSDVETAIAPFGGRLAGAFENRA